MSLIFVETAIIQANLMWLGIFRMLKNVTKLEKYIKKTQFVYKKILYIYKR